MIGYFCATPFHITAAITMQSGMFAAEPATLVILNHFNVDEELLERIRSTGIFEQVLLYDNNYRTKTDNFKRFMNAFFPVKFMRDLANKTAFSHFVCFALNFIDLTYMIKRYEKRGIACEFAFGDDGVGTYIRPGIYRPKPLSEKLLRLNGRLKWVDEVKRVYAYKPDFMVANREYDVQPIQQSEEACAARRKAVRIIWPVSDVAAIDGNVLYFEQPHEDGAGSEVAKIELASLRLAVDRLGAQGVIKMHPRSMEEALWKDFNVLKAKMPYEVMLLQKQCAPALMMTVSSTALFSTYLFDDLPAASCPAVMLYKLMPQAPGSLSAQLDELCRTINEAQPSPCIFPVENREELEHFLENRKA